MFAVSPSLLVLDYYLCRYVISFWKFKDPNQFRRNNFSFTEYVRLILNFKSIWLYVWLSLKLFSGANREFRLFEKFLISPEKIYIEINIKLIFGPEALLFLSFCMVSISTCQSWLNTYSALTSKIVWSGFCRNVTWV